MDQVVLAFEGNRTNERVRDMIEGAGLAECTICRSAGEVKRLVQQRQVTAVICGYKLRDESAQGLLADLPAYCSLLVIAMQDMLDMVESEDIFKLAAPVSRGDLLASVRMLLQLGRRMERYVRPQRSRQEREVVDAAKTLLMDRHGMTEAQAHHFLQKKSMDSGVKLVQMAQMLLDGAWNG